MNIEKEIEALKARNRRVELDKAWETSPARIVCIALITYLFMVLVFTIIGVKNSWLNALIPTLGFGLSNLSLNWLKRIWVKNNDKNS